MYAIEKVVPVHLELSQSAEGVIIQKYDEVIVRNAMLPQFSAPRVAYDRVVRISISFLRLISVMSDLCLEGRNKPLKD